MAASDDNGSGGPGELFLIDGNSLAYRAFFALPESIATSDGRPTNAIYGFASMMVKILTDFDPRAVAVAWDAGMSGREKVYEPYKAQRSSRPDLLREQWPHLAPLADAFGFANVRVEGWEADDVIATLAVQASEHEIPVMIVSGDRDAYQLVNDGVRVMSTSRGVTDTKIYDTAAVIERYGVPPELVPDLIGLKGDTSDNIPGVPGVGEKTASQLLQKYGSVDGVLDNIDEISGPKRKQNLTEHAEDARISKRLATMHFDVDVAARPGRADGARARPLATAGGGGGVRAAPGDPAPRGRVGAAGPRADHAGADRAGGRGGNARRPRLGRGGVRARPALAGRPTTDRACSSATPPVPRSCATRSPLTRSSPTTPSRSARRDPAGCSVRSRRDRSTSPTTRWSPPT